MVRLWHAAGRSVRFLDARDGFHGNITLGAVKDFPVINRQWVPPLGDVVNHDFNLNGWPCDVYVPPSHDGTKPYGIHKQGHPVSSMLFYLHHQHVTSALNP